MSSSTGGGKSGGDCTSTGTSKADSDNKSDQCNPNNSKYEGHSSGYSGTGTKDDLDNHSDQKNPNNKKHQPKGGK